MASKKQRKRKQKARRSASSRSADDFLQLPTGFMAREGRIIRTVNDATPEECAEFRKGYLSAKPELEQKMAQERERLLDILRMVDPVDFVARASLMYLNFDVDEYKEWNDDRSLAHIEYLALQALAVGLDSQSTVGSADASHLTTEAINLTRSLFGMSRELIFMKALESYTLGTGSKLTEYQMEARLGSLGVRGTGYAEHLKRVILGCFSPFDEVCRATLGFTAADALAVHRGLGDLIQSRIDVRAAEAARSNREMMAELKRARKAGFSRVFPEELLKLAPNKLKQFIDVMAWTSIFADSRAIAIITIEDLVRVTELEADAAQSFLDAFSCAASDFNEQYHAYPVGAHPLTRSPVLRVGDGYMIPVPHTMLDAIRPRMEDLLREYPEAWERYSRHRGKFVECEAVKLLAGAFPGSRSWTSLQWRSENDSSDLDGLVDAGDVALRIQCKAGRITAPVRRGAPDRMVEELDKLIGEAAQQHARLDDALQQFNPDGLGFSQGQAAAFGRPLQFEVIVTLDEVTTWATQAHELTFVRLLPQERPIPWILSLSDLMAVVDLLEGGLLAHYLVRRSRLERDGRIEAHDELDWVGHYIDEGLFFDSFLTGDEAPRKIRLLSYTEPIDAWYFTRQGDRRVPAPKPSRKIPNALALLLHRLEKERPKNWLLASIALLDGSEKSQAIWARGVERARARVLTEGWSNTTQIFSDLLGMTLYIDHRQHPAELRHSACTLARDKAEEHALANWIVIGEASDRHLFVVLHTDAGTTNLIECFLAPARQDPISSN